MKKDSTIFKLFIFIKISTETEILKNIFTLNLESVLKVGR